jgi:hypothetical protein
MFNGAAVYPRRPASADFFLHREKPLPARRFVAARYPQRPSARSSCEQDSTSARLPSMHARSPRSKGCA